MNTLKQRLNFVFARENTRRLMNNECRLTKTDLWKAAKLSSSAASHWFNGTNEMDLQTAFMVAPLLRCNPIWLFDGSGQAYANLLPSSDTQLTFKQAESNAEDAPALMAGKRVPVVGTAQLGDNGYWAELETPVGHGDGYIPFPVRTSNAYALRCRGESMKPRIKHGEFVIVEPEVPPSPGDEVLVKAIDGRVMVKELLYVRDGTVHLLSVNESHGKLAIPLIEIECMHFVTAIARRSMWEHD